MEDRTKNAAITLALGLALNIALGVGKLVVGISASSASVTSDAVNNLSDAAVSVMAIVATVLSARAADHDHPYGHGRYEYIAAFILGAVIAAVGVEVFINGVRRAIEPVTVGADGVMFGVLAASIAVKGIMFVLYTVKGRRTRSDAVRAAAVDSASDMAVTSAVLACALIERYTGAHIDGYASIAVAVVILVFAVRLLRSTVSRLLGERPDPELYGRVRDIILAAPHVISVHDLVINDYGSSHKIAEADAVFDAGMTFADVHAACDAAERAVREKTGIKLSLHADPSSSGDDRVEKIRRGVQSALASFGASAHDIYVDDGKRTVELDILIPDDGAPCDEIAELAKAACAAVVEYAVNVHIDYV